MFWSVSLALMDTRPLGAKLGDEPTASPQRSGMGCRKRAELNPIHERGFALLGETGTGGVLCLDGHDTVSVGAQNLVHQAEDPVHGVQTETATGGHDIEVVILGGGFQVEPLDELGIGADVPVHIVVGEDHPVEHVDGPFQLGAKTLQVGDRGAMQRCRDTYDRAATGDGLGCVDEHTATLAVPMQHHLCLSGNLGVDELGKLLGCSTQTTAGIGEPNTVDGAVSITMNGLGRLVQGICLEQRAIGVDPDGVAVAVNDDRCAILSLL